MLEKMWKRKFKILWFGGKSKKLGFLLYNFVKKKNVGKILFLYVCFFLLVGNECFCGNFLLYNFIKKFKKKNLGIIVFVFIFYRLGMNVFVGIV